MNFSNDEKKPMSALNLKGVIGQSDHHTNEEETQSDRLHILTKENLKKFDDLTKVSTTNCS